MRVRRFRDPGGRLASDTRPLRPDPRTAHRRRGTSLRLGGQQLATIVKTPDGRELAVKVIGAPGGAPVFVFHGTPGSRFGPYPRVPALYRQAVRLIAYDRPGYGDSHRLPGRAVAHAAEDVRAIADFLGIDRFSVLGRSGGGPHALACAALLGPRVDRAAVLVTLAPRDAQGLDWYAGMGESNVLTYRTAEAAPAAVTARLQVQAALMRHDPTAHLPFRRPELPESDRRLAADFGLRALLSSIFAEGVKTSGHGWVDDVLSFVAPWGFDPTVVESPVLLWHGAKDVFSPVGHTLWLAQRLRQSLLVIEERAAHLGSMAVLPQALGWLVDPSQAWRSMA